MGIFTSEEKIREEIEKRLRTEMQLELIESEKKAKAIEAKEILEEAEIKAEEIREKAREEIKEEKENLRIALENHKNQIKTVQNLKRIVREKNLANLRNLAQTVPMVRVKREIKRANKQLIYLEDVDEKLQYAIRLAKTRIQPPKETAPGYDEELF